MASTKKKKTTKKKRSRSANTTDPEDILAQCLIALGQGAGDFYFAPSGVQAVRSIYWDRITEHAGTWSTDAPNILNQARALGRIAADFASADGAAVVTGDHFKKSVRSFERGQDQGLFWPLGCRWCQA